MATEAADVDGAPNENPPKPVGAAEPNAGAGAPKVVDDGGDDDDGAALNPNVAAAGAGAGDATLEF